MDRAAVREALRLRGVVGLGGAAFPSHRKLPGAEQGAIATLVINAAECEPHISCDDALMRAAPADVIRGAVVLGELCGAREVVIGIEDNKPEAAAALVEASRDSGVQVRVVPARYPVGAARQLIYTVTGIAVPARDHATQHGVQCFNVATAVAVHRALDLGEPLIDRIVTVSGEVDQPRNFRAPLGTSLGALLQRAGRRAGA
jgi:electron transport complex protein RnfC